MSELINYTGEQLELLRNQVCPNHNDGQFALAIETAKHMGLDLFKRQYYSVVRQDRNGKESQQMGATIEGLRTIAHRTGAYAGRSQMVFEWPLDQNGKPNKSGKPLSVSCYVKRIVQGVVAEFHATIYPREFRGMLHGSMPIVMASKCCEAAAIRSGFPEAGGVYLAEELPPEEEEVELRKRVEVDAFTDSKIKDGLIEDVRGLLKTFTDGWEVAEKGKLLYELTGKRTFGELNTLATPKIEEVKARLIGRMRAAETVKEVVSEVVKDTEPPEPALKDSEFYADKIERILRDNSGDFEGRDGLVEALKDSSDCAATLRAALENYENKEG